MAVDFSKLSLNLNFKTKHKMRAPTNVDKVLTKQIECKCIYSDGKFTVTIPYTAYMNKCKKGVELKEVGSKDLTLEFTPESYSLDDVDRAFTRFGQGTKNYICLVRNESDRIFKKLDPNRYVPFCHNWIIHVRIVRRGGLLYADFRGLVTIDGHNYNVKHDDEDE
uniref:Uncharacterized protein n=1 Tax=Geladintestivirus 3 TaxID=3233135 RepID=A0AAU8MJC2_9CAUD